MDNARPNTHYFFYQKGSASQEHFPQRTLLFSWGNRVYKCELNFYNYNNTSTPCWDVLLSNERLVTEVCRVISAILPSGLEGCFCLSILRNKTTNASFLSVSCDHVTMARFTGADLTFKKMVFQTMTLMWYFVQNIKINKTLQVSRQIKQVWD